MRRFGLFCVKATVVKGTWRTAEWTSKTLHATLRKLGGITFLENSVTAKHTLGIVILRHVEQSLERKKKII